MKRVLIFTNSINGLYSFRKELIQKLIDEGYNVAISSPIDERVSDFLKKGCKHIETSINRRGINPIEDFKLISQYIKIIRKEKPEIVLTYTIKPNIYAGIACGLLNMPFITNITGLGTSIESKGLVQNISLNLYRLALRKSSCIFFQNSSNQQFFIDKKIVKNKSILLPGSGVNLTDNNFEEYPDNDDVTNFLFIGRVMKAKGINELLIAAEQVKEKYPKVHFDLIGRKEENYTLLLEQYAEKKVVKYHGPQKDVHKFITNSHAVINPSYHEGMSNVLLEAASTGRPILASNTPGCRETFDESVSGYGFEPKNVSSLFEAIIKFIELPYEEKKRMGLAGRKKMEKEFDRNLVVNAYMDEINKIFIR